MLLNFISIFKFKFSSYSLFGVIYQLQILMLLPILNVNVGEDAIDFFRYNHDFLFNFNFMSNSDEEETRKLFEVSGQNLVRLKLIMIHIEYF